MDATNTNKNLPRNGIADRMIKQTRKDKLKSNHGRTEFSKNSKSANAIEKHNLRLKCIDSYLTLLPDTQLHAPAKHLASIILSTAIERKHHFEVLQKATKIQTSFQAPQDSNSNLVEPKPSLVPPPLKISRLRQRVKFWNSATT